MSTPVNGVIVNYVKGPRTQRPRECLIRFTDAKSVSEASRLIGRKVAWPVRERKCLGRIVATHGRNGLVIARFRKGVPGKALGGLVEIVG